MHVRPCVRIPHPTAICAPTPPASVCVDSGAVLLLPLLHSPGPVLPSPPPPRIAPQAPPARAPPPPPPRPLPAAPADAYLEPTVANLDVASLACQPFAGFRDALEAPAASSAPSGSPSHRDTRPVAPAALPQILGLLLAKQRRRLRYAAALRDYLTLLRTCATADEAQAGAESRCAVVLPGPLGGRALPGHRAGPF